MKKSANHVQSAYLTIFRAYALNTVAHIPMPDNLHKLIKQAIYEVTLPLFEVIKCSKQQAWNKFCNHLVGAIRTIAGDTKEIQKIIDKLERELTKEK